MASEQEEIQLFNEIISRGCCRRCALRYLGHDRTLIAFDYPNTSLVNFGLLSPMEEFEIGPASKIKKSSPCTVCLGVLDDSVIEGMLTHENLAKTMEYLHTTFVTYITFPTCVLVRDHSMILHLKKTFKHFNAKEVIRINHAWRDAILPRLSKTLKKKYDRLSKFILHFYLEYSLEDDEMAVIQNFAKGHFDQPLSRHNVAALLDSTPDEKFSQLVNIPPKEPFYGVELKEVKFFSDAIHVMGNYCKYSRDLLQKPLVVEGVVMIEKSVETIILKAVQEVAGDFKEMVFKASSFDYHQYRILGNGRTFHLQLNDPKFEGLSRENSKKVEDIIRKSGVMEVKNLRQAEKRDVSAAMDSEQLSPYSYRILCIVYQCKNIDYCINAVNMYQTILVSQKTPIRLLHHREVRKKKRKIYYIKAKKVRDNLIELELCAQCGFYLNEFVHGDFGRTVPSLGEIMKAKVEILAVDVVDFQSTLECATEEGEVVI